MAYWDQWVSVVGWKVTTFTWSTLFSTNVIKLIFVATRYFHQCSITSMYSKFKGSNKYTIRCWSCETDCKKTRGQYMFISVILPCVRKHYTKWKQKQHNSHRICVNVSKIVMKFPRVSLYLLTNKANNLPKVVFT